MTGIDQVIGAIVQYRFFVELDLRYIFQMLALSIKTITIYRAAYIKMKWRRKVDRHSLAQSPRSLRTGSCAIRHPSVPSFVSDLSLLA